ncbi:MAG: hypothetical protein JWL96_1624 [Sphingomonas bacterium]|nr:hypothetical protein [Sphingomonas bacterium]
MDSGVRWDTPFASWKNLRGRPADLKGRVGSTGKIADVPKLVENAEAAPKARGPYKKLVA